MPADENTTPLASPPLSRQQTIITVSQKQALVDNLQLEITERARKLRAQYALHALGLRSRLEMRVNRIPQALRATNIEELIDQYSEHLDQSKTFPLSASISGRVEMQYTKQTSHVLNSHVQGIGSPSRYRGTKRPSAEMNFGSDKENVHVGLDMPKKRTKTAAATSGTTSAKSSSRPERAPSRKIIPTQILSPKSSNSRTLAQSPLRASPTRSYLARPVSPTKAAGSSSTSQASTASQSDKPKPRQRGASKQTASASTASTGTVGRGKGTTAAAATTTATTIPAPPTALPPKAVRGRGPRNSSSASDASAGTTIVTKKSTTAKGRFMGKVTGKITSVAGRKGQTLKKAAPDTAPPPETGRRVLRARK